MMWYKKKIYIKDEALWLCRNFLKDTIQPTFGESLKGKLTKKILIDFRCKGNFYFKLLNRKFYIVYHWHEFDFR